MPDDETSPPAGRGAELLAAVRAGDAAIQAAWDSRDTLPRNPGGWIDKDIRDAFDARLHQAQDARETAAAACWAYFEGRGRDTGPEATAEELAAWELLQRRVWTAPATPTMDRPMTVPGGNPDGT